MKRLLSVLAVSAVICAAPLAAAKAQHLHDRMAGANHVSSMGKNLKLGPKDLKGYDVRKIQKKLYEKGYYPEPADGVWGPKTTNAIRKYQKMNGLTAHGMLDQKTLSHMGVEVNAVADYHK